MEAKDKIFAIKVILIVGSIFYTFVYVWESYENSFWEIWTILEGAGTILLLPLGLTFVIIQGGVVLLKKEVKEDEWLLTYFFFWTLVVVLSFIKGLNIFPD